MPPKKQTNKPLCDTDVFIIREKGINAKGFGHVAKAIMTDRTLDLGSKSLYAYLSSAAGSGEETFMRRSRILAEMKMSEDAYLKYMTSLEKHGYIIRAQSRTSGGVFGTTVVEFVMLPARFADKIKEAQSNETKPTMYSGTVYALGYGVMPRLVARDTNASYKSRGLFAYYTVFANTDGEAFPSRDKILLDLDISKNTYTKLLKELTSLGYLTVTQTHTPDGKMGKSIVRINMHPEEALAKKAEEDKRKAEAAATAPCTKKPGTVENVPCTKKPGTVEDAPCTKKPGAVEAPCTNLPCPVKPCPEKPGTVFNNTNTIFATNTNNPLLDRLIDTVRERMHFSILQFAYENDPAGLEAINLLLEGIVEVFASKNSRVQIGKEIISTKNASEVLMNISNEATVAVVERYLARTDTVQNPKAYLLTAIYREILVPTSDYATPDPREEAY